MYLRRADQCYLRRTDPINAREVMTINSVSAGTPMTRSKHTIFPLGFGVTAGDNQHRALRVTHDVFCDAPDYSMLESGAAVSRSDDEINVWASPLRHRFRRPRDQGEFGFNDQIAQKSICLSAFISCRAVSSTASASPERRTPARSTNT